MDIEFKVKNFTHEDLVDIFSTAFDGNYEIYIDWKDSDEAELRAQGKINENSCIEDILAEIVLDGRSFDIVDYEQCEHDNTGVDLYGGFRGRWVERCDFPEEDYHLCDNINYAAVYAITLDSLLKAASTEEGYGYAKAVLDGEGDYYDGNNFIQLAMFGEVIYG